MNKILLVIILTVVISACGSKFVWNRPSSKYRECLRENQDNPSRCDDLKKAYESEIESLRNMSDDPSGGGGLYRK